MVEIDKLEQSTRAFDLRFCFAIHGSDEPANPFHNIGEGDEAVISLLMHISYRIKTIK